MGKYLQSVGIKYSMEQLIGTNECAEQKVREAATVFEYFLGKAKIESKGTAKVNLVGGAVSESINERLDIIDYAHPYHLIDKLGRNESVETIQAAFIQEVTDALVRVGKLRGWDTEAIDKLHQHVKGRHYKFEEVWVKPKPNASGTYAVGVDWVTEKCTEVAFLVGRPGSKEMDRHRIICIKTGLGLIEGILGKFAWENNSLARLWNANKRDFWELNVDTMGVEFHYGPAASGNPHGEYALGKMYLDGDVLVNQDRDKAVQWLKKSADHGFERARKLLETLNS